MGTSADRRRICGLARLTRRRPDPASPTGGHRGVCLRAGYLSLRRIASTFDIPFDRNPKPDDPISVTREEFLAAYEQLVSFGVPVRPDREQCYRDYAGWRVNYDEVLVALCGITMAPYAMWSSDRSILKTHTKGAGIWRRAKERVHDRAS